jgi:hypothetical protein
MPRRKTQTKDGTRRVLKNIAFESRVVGWLMEDGWQVFIPMLDNGHQTDILISDGPNYFRIQVKTIEPKGDNHVVQNCWQGSCVDLVIFFARNSTWGVITPAFAEKKRCLNHEGHRKFQQSKKDFLREFHLFE